MIPGDGSSFPEADKALISRGWRGTVGPDINHAMLCAGAHAVSNRVQPAFDPRGEPGALAAHAGICAGGEEQASSPPRPLFESAGVFAKY